MNKMNLDNLLEQFDKMVNEYEKVLPLALDIISPAGCSLTTSSKLVSGKFISTLICTCTGTRTLIPGSFLQCYGKFQCLLSRFEPVDHYIFRRMLC